MYNCKFAIQLNGTAVLLVLLIAAITIHQWYRVNSIGNDLSLADPWTEADTIRAAEAFATHGFTYNKGLPDIAFGEQFADKGTKNSLNNSDEIQSWTEGTLIARTEKYKVGPDSFVYTHYPPGPHWIAGIAAKIFGVHEVKYFRIFPVLIGLLSIAFFSWQVIKFAGAIRGGIAIVLLHLTPMFLNMMHGLSYQGYSLSLLLLQIGLCLRVFSFREVSFLDLLLFFAISHLQGWMSFDYVFLVIASPLLILLLFPKSIVKLSHAYLIILVCTAGFIVSHAIHFYQVTSYFNSFDKALSDFIGTASYRSNAKTYDDGTITPSMLSILWSYLTIHSGNTIHFGIPVIYYAAIGAMIVLINSPQEKYRLIIGIILSTLIASLWVIIMPQHAAQHWHFIPRHYFISVFITTIAVLISIKLKEQEN